MDIVVNGEPHTLPDGSTAADLIRKLALENKRLAMEVNQDLVPRSTFDTHVLKTGDTVEIVHAIGGG